MTSVIYMWHFPSSQEGSGFAQSECRACISVTINNNRRYRHITSVSTEVRREGNKTKF